LEAINLEVLVPEGGMMRAETVFVGSLVIVGICNRGGVVLVGRVATVMS
jgi:hypothetical protein